MKCKLTIVIPAYNEENSVKRTVLECKKFNGDSNILVIDDHSGDKTALILKELQKKTKGLDVIRHEKNKGYGAALVTGFKNSKTNYVAFLDSDMTYHPKYLAGMLKKLEENNLDCVWGNRFGSNMNHMPLIRKIGNRLLVVLFFLTTGKYVADVSCGERVFRRESLDKIDAQSLPRGLDMITAMTKRTIARKLRFELLPIDYPKRPGASKLKIVNDFLQMAKNILLEN